MSVLKGPYACFLQTVEIGRYGLLVHSTLVGAEIVERVEETCYDVPSHAAFRRVELFCIINVSEENVSRNLGGTLTNYSILTVEVAKTSCV